MPLKDLTQLKYHNNHKDLLDIVKNVIESPSIGLSEDEYNFIKGSIFVVARRTLELPEFSCRINIKKDEGVNIYMKKWTINFINGYRTRASKRVSNPIGTMHDSILDVIIKARIGISDENLTIIRYGHRLAMSAENITGALLEEYIAMKLKNYNWHCCWGETMRSIDFCNSDGQLLQVKNSDNSENSSSRTVRDGTKIQHWFRRFSRKGTTNWPKLNNLLGIYSESDILSEDSFKEFVRTSISNNPDSVHLEDGNPWT